MSGLAGLLLLGGALLLAADQGGRLALLYLLGGAFGLVLYHAAFGFASSWRAFLAEGRGAGLRAQLLMLALAALLFQPVLAEGGLLGRPVVGAVAPFGLSVVVGAFLFGIGMQLGGGCASGTLYALGGGALRMLAVVLFFMVGSLLGTLHLPFWLGTPNLGAVSLPASLGTAWALLLQLAVFALLLLASLLLERRRHGGLLPDPAYLVPCDRLRRLIRGPWPLLWGAALLALLNFATLAIAGHPWNISFGYTIWGARGAALLGLDVGAWEFWTWSYPKRALEGGIFAETTSVMNFGIVAGALLGAGLAGTFRLRWRAGFHVGARPWGAAVLGGLLMGYGARLAFGCNVGAFFSGIASGSLHGWLWLVAGLAGSYLGLRLRPRFAMD